VSEEVTSKVTLSLFESEFEVKKKEALFTQQGYHLNAIIKLNPPLFKVFVKCKQGLHGKCLFVWLL
jgi:hypothetical protein